MEGENRPFRDAGVRWPLALALLALASLGFAQPTEAQSLASLRERVQSARASGARSVPEGTLLTLDHQLDVAARIAGEFPERSADWRQRVARYLRSVESGADPLPSERGKIIERGYRSPVSTLLQGYAVYIPPDYDPERAYPVYVALHGGSSNGNLFLGVVLGNNMDWQTYDQHLYDEFVPRWSPDWIVVAPTGFGQIMWRWMGERDVLDVIRDVMRHYHVDEDQVVLGGLSNGGLGAYAIGARHAWRFSTVQAMAGAPSWAQYLGGRMPAEQREAVLPWSALDLAENTVSTDFRYYHGRRDGGPMRPAYVEEFSAALDRLGLRKNERWFDLGHDILYPVHRRGRVYRTLAEVRRDRRPREVSVVTGDYRAARQHWIEVDRIADFPRLARVHAQVDAAKLTIETSNTTAFSVDLRDAPLEAVDVSVEVDGETVYEGPLSALGHRLHLRRAGGAWSPGYPDEVATLTKGPGLSGPIMDAYFDRMVHVYGTANDEHTATLRRAAERGARGWPLFSWQLRQEVLPDTEVDEATLNSAHIVLYGSPGDNALLERVAPELPIRIEADAVVVGDARFEGEDVGVRFIYPNPFSPHRYLIVQAGVTPRAVADGNRLPEFLPDYAVYDRRTIGGSRRRIFTNSHPARALGYFDASWRLPPGDQSSM